MKKFNLRLLTILLAVFSIAFVSCDEEDTTKENSFKYDGKTYKVSKALLENYGLSSKNSFSSNYAFDLSFLTTGFNINETLGEISGSGSFVRLSIESYLSTQLSSGAYNFGTDGTFKYGELGINIEFSTGNNNLKVVAGFITVKINESGSEYELELDCTLENNKKLTAFYKGTLIYIDRITTPTDYFRYDNINYNISKGYLENYGIVSVKSVSSYNLDLTFLTSGITYDTTSVEITGTGSYLYFEMFSTSETQLTPGTYTFDLYETYNSGTFDYAELAINYNFATETGSFVDFVAGTVVVKLTETTYEITINLTSTENKVLTGYFKGTLTYVDLTEMPVKSNQIKPFKR